MYFSIRLKMARWSADVRRDYHKKRNRCLGQAYFLTTLRCSTIDGNILFLLEISMKQAKGFSRALCEVGQVGSNRFSDG